MKKFKDSYFLIIGLVLCLLVTWGIYYRDHHVTRFIASSIEKLSIDYDSIIFSLEEEKIINSESLFLSGFVFKEGENIDFFHSYILLKEELVEDYLVLPTSMVKREDIAQQFGASDGCNYVNSGFEASINLNELTKSKRYEVVVLYMNNDNLLLHPTNIWIEI